MFIKLGKSFIQDPCPGKFKILLRMREAFKANHNYVKKSIFQKSCFLYLKNFERQCVSKICSSRAANEDSVKQRETSDEYRCRK